MIPIIIADDEKLDLEYLLKVVNYNELGLEIVAVCRDGNDLMHKINELKPKIVISDIIMPEVSGLEIAHKIKNSNRDVKTVFITGHQNFKYAQIALEYDVCRYLVKPVLPEQLHEVLSGLVNECIEENRQTYEKKLFKCQLEQNMPLIRDVIVRKLINGTISTEEPIEEKLQFCGISLHPEEIISLLILPKYNNIEAEYKRKLTYLSVKNATEDFFDTLGAAYCSMSEYESLSLLFNSMDKNNSAAVIALADKLYHTILTQTGISVTIGIGKMVNGYENIPSSFACAERALQARFFLESEQIISFSDIAEEIPSGIPRIKRHQHSLCNMVKCGNSKEISHIINDVSFIATKNHLSVEYLRIFCVELLSKVISEQYETNSINLESIAVAQFYTDLIDLKSIEALLLKIEEILLHLSTKSQTQMMDRTKVLVEKIKDIIYEQYSKDISIDNISMQVYISSGYATRIFKKSTGISINSFITNVRMKKAAELLTLPEYRVKDVAKAVGYNNVAYFCSVFRKQFGHPPNQYRINIKEQ